MTLSGFNRHWGCYFEYTLTTAIFKEKQTV